MGRARWALLLVLLGCGRAESMGHNLREGTPCSRSDRRCIAGSSFKGLLAILWGGPTGAQIASGTLLDTKGNAVTTVRAQGTECTKSDNTMTLLSSNQPCTEYDGVVSLDTAVKSTLWSEDFSQASWVKDTGMTVNAQTGTAPDGSANGSNLVIGGSATSTSRLHQVFTSTASAYYTMSVWAWTDSSAAPVDVRLSATQDSGTVSWTGAVVSQTFAVGPRPRRIWLTAQASGTSLDVGIGGENSTPLAPMTGTIHLWGWDTQRGIHCDGGGANCSGVDGRLPYIKTTNATVTTVQTKLSISNPFTTGAWGVSMSVNPMLPNANSFQFAIGTFNGVNSAYAFWTSNTQLTVRINDAANAQKQWVVNGMSMFDGAMHNIGVFADGAGAASVYFDGTLKTSTISGAGTGIIGTQPATIKLLNEGGSSFPFGAFARDICFDTTAATCIKSQPTRTVLNLDAVGDSITSGSGVGTGYLPYPQSAGQGLGTGYLFQNGGAPGARVATLKSNYEADPLKGHFARCTFLGGINDIFTDGTTAAATYATAVTLLDEMRSDGCSPLIILNTPAVGTTLGAGWTSGKQTQYDAYRTLLSGYATTYGLTAIDTYPTMGDGATPPALAAAFDSGDHTHPNEYGAAELARLVLAQLP